MSIDCYCDYDPPEFHSSRIVKAARREHKCEECCKPIKIGERYEYVFGMWDGYLSEFKTCARCLDIRQWVKNNVPCFCWAHGNMLGDAKETVEEAAWRAPEETIGLRFGFNRLLHSLGYPV